MVAVIEVRSRHSLATQAVNVWHWQIPNASPVAEAQVCINAVNVLYTNLLTRIAAGTFTTDGLVRTVGPGGNVFIQASTAQTVCTNATILPLSAAVVLQFRSGLVGGSRRGRKYIGPIGVSNMNADGRTVASAALTAFGAEAAALTAVNGSGVAFGVWSRKLGQFTECNISSVNGILGQQRKRLT